MNRELLLGCVNVFKSNRQAGTVLRVALSHGFLQLDVEERRVLPGFLLSDLVEDGRVEVIHGVATFHQEKVPHGLQVFNQPVILLQGAHEVAAAIQVLLVDVRVEAGPQGQLESLAGHRLCRAVHTDVATRKLLVEVALLQVQPGKVESQQRVVDVLQLQVPQCAGLQLHEVGLGGLSLGEHGSGGLVSTTKA